MSFDIKYRPQTLDEFIGNDIVCDELRTWLDYESRKRVLLFAGPPGCGKTTLAKILTKGLGCKDLNFYELNISNTGGVDDARALIEDMRYPPKGGGVKVYLLDECQEASLKFQQALLTPLEDKLPSYAYVFFCTTDPHKLKPALRSRCAKFDIKPLVPTKLRKLLRWVLEQEKIKDFPEKALERISQVSSSPREALVILDKVLAFTDEGDIIKAIDRVKADELTVRDLCHAMMEGKQWSEIARILRSLQQDDPESVRQGVLTYCNSVLIGGKKSMRAAIIIECFKDPFYNSGKAGLALACYGAVME